MSRDRRKEEKLDRLERKINALYKLVTTWARKQGIDVEKVVKETRKRRKKRKRDEEHIKSVKVRRSDE